LGVIAVSLLLGTGALGCNAYDGLGPSPTHVDDLLADARTALTTGHPQRAVHLLETAYRKDSTDVEVRIELANALYASQAIEVFTLRAALERMREGEEGSGPETSEGTVCTDGVAPSGSLERLGGERLEESEALRRLAEHRDRLRRVSHLLVDGVLSRRREAFAALRPDIQAKGYLLAALTRLGHRLLDVRTAVLRTESTLYLDTEKEPLALVVCSATETARARVARSLCRLRRGAQQARSWLRTRNDRTHSEQTRLLIDAVTRQTKVLRGRLSCGPASRARVDAPRLDDRRGR
jgi:hypothetical protein